MRLYTILIFSLVLALAFAQDNGGDDGGVAGGDGDNGASGLINIVSGSSSNSSSAGSPSGGSNHTGIGRQKCLKRLTFLNEAIAQKRSFFLKALRNIMYHTKLVLQADKKLKKYLKRRRKLNCLINIVLGISRVSSSAGSTSGGSNHSSIRRKNCMKRLKFLNEAIAQKRNSFFKALRSVMYHRKLVLQTENKLKKYLKRRRRLNCF